jgi:hypothetical protein
MPTPHAAATPMIAAIQTALRMVIPLMWFCYLWTSESRERLEDRMLRCNFIAPAALFTAS